MTEADEILKEYGLDRSMAKKYIDAMVRKNQKATAEEIETSRTTIQNYKKAFQQMTDQERAQVIYDLMGERYWSNRLLQ